MSNSESLLLFFFHLTFLSYLLANKVDNVLKLYISQQFFTVFSQPIPADFLLNFTWHNYSKLDIAYQWN